jgi:hypothetical protein
VCLISSGSSGSAAAGLLASLATVDGGAIDKRNKLIHSLKRKKISNLRLRIKETLQYMILVQKIKG